MYGQNYFFLVFFYLGFPSRTFTNQRTAGEEGGYFFISSIQLPPASQTLSRGITAESSPLHIASSRTRTGNLWYFFNSSLRLPPASQTFSQGITAESSPLHIASSPARIGNLWFSIYTCLKEVSQLITMMPLCCSSSCSEKIP